jgi:hypothetical protein
VNEQYGTLYKDGVYPGGAPSPLHACTWGFNPNDVTAISMASQEASIWASNINFGSSPISTNVQSFKEAGMTGGACVTGPAGGPMASLTNDELLVVAAWPNNGN